MRRVSAPPGQPLILTASDGVKLAGSCWSTAQPAGIVIAHGLLADHSLPALRWLARALSRDFTVLAFSFRGNHLSQGRFTFGIDEWRDVTAAARFLRQSGCRRVGVTGFSFGGFNAILAAWRSAELDSLALVSTPSRLNVLGSHHFRLGLLTQARFGLSHRRNIPRCSLSWRPDRRVAPHQVLGEIVAPKLFVSGSDDPIVHPSHSHLLYRRSRGPKELRLLPGGLHAELLIVQFGDLFVELLADWFRRTLAT